MDFYQRLELGYALREGRAGKEFPAFRVVNAKGILSGAAAFETPDLQRLLLETEGVELAETPGGSETVWLEAFHGGGRTALRNVSEERERKEETAGGTI